MYECKIECKIAPAKHALFKTLSSYGVRELTEQELGYTNREANLLISYILKNKLFRKLYINSRKLSNLNKIAYFIRHRDELEHVIDDYWSVKFLNVGQ